MAPERRNVLILSALGIVLAVIAYRLVTDTTGPSTAQAVALRAEPEGRAMIRKLSDGRYRLYSRKLDPRTDKRRNLGTFATRAAAEKHERAVQYFKRAS